MIRSDEQRRAMYAKMHTRRFAFPLKGGGGRAQRNRGTLYGVGAAAASGAILFAVTRRGPGLGTLLRPGFIGDGDYVPVFNKAGKMVRTVGGKITGRSTFVYSRAPEGSEKFWMGMPGMGKLFGANRRNAQHLPEALQGKVHSVPPLAKVEVLVRRGIRNKLAGEVDKASIWKIGGSGDGTLRGVQYGADLLKLRTGKLISMARNRLVTPRVFTTRSLPLPSPDPAEALKKSGRITIALKRPVREAAPVERFVTKPFRAVSRRLRRYDVVATRRMQQWARRQGKQA